MPPPDAAVELLHETAYAKVNLALHVRARRPDGYHAIESVFIFAEDGDRLSAEATDDGAIDLVVDGPFAAGLDNGSDNLVIKAARALQAYLGEQRGAVIRLNKRLPVASGIGGGSADAAATFRLLVRCWDARIDALELEALALDLGSDVPACVSSAPQMVTGRGETLDRFAPDGLDGAWLLLVNPGVSVSTAAVFKRWDGVDRGALAITSLDDVIVHGRNDLEGPAVALAPDIAEVLETLRGAPHARVARMSGSGATCFALFDSESACAAAARSVAMSHSNWWVLPTRVRA